MWIHLRLKLLIARFFKRLLRLRLLKLHDFQTIQHGIESFGNLIQLVPMIRWKPQRAVAAFDSAHDVRDSLYANAHSPAERSGKGRANEHQHIASTPRMVRIFLQLLRSSISSVNNVTMIPYSPTSEER